MTLSRLYVAVVASLVVGSGAVQAADRIVHDGEYEFLRMQHGERWDAAKRKATEMTINPKKIKFQRE